jgi:hypothetical protein
MKKAWVAVIILNIRVKKRKMEIGMIMAEGQALIRPKRMASSNHAGNMGARAQTEHSKRLCAELEAKRLPEASSTRRTVQHTPQRP